MRSHISRKLIVLLLVAVVLSCSEKTTETELPFIAKIGDRVITPNEFIQRSEYTIRPVWCRRNDNVQRKIILNSLVAEKILALEGIRKGTDWINNAAMQNYLQGRKEQEMRQLHYNNNALEKVELTPEEKNSTRLLSERTYDVQILPVNNDQLAERIAKDMQSGITDFDALTEEFQAATGIEIKEQQIRFDSPVDDLLFKQLFLNNLEKGQVVGPVHGEKNQNFLIRVNGWTRRPLISDVESRQRDHDVTERLTEIRARDIYESWIKDLMQGKRLEFNEPVFRQVTEAIGQDYFRSPEERKMIFKKKLWNEDTGENEMVIDDIRTQLDEIADQILFDYDGEPWTVSQFESYLQVHPLVFRNRKMAKGEFANEFKNAIADMIRDKEITKIAYDLKLDMDQRVIHRMNMWQDNLIALYERNKLLETSETDSLNQMQIVEQYLDPQFETLFRTYSDQIEIDTDVFDNIKLTSIDMFVLQNNMPFPVVVPQFPSLTTYNRLDYGRKAIRE